MSSKTKRSTSSDSKPDHKAKGNKSALSPRKEIPLVSVPDEQGAIAEEMAELFEEDQVTHKHGSSEPEGD